MIEQQARKHTLKRITRGKQRNTADMLTALTRPKEEIVRLSDENYGWHSRAPVEPCHHGQIVSIDVDSGNLIFTDDIIEAVGRLRARWAVWFLRVGYPAVHKSGSRSLGNIR